MARNSPRHHFTKFLKDSLKPSKKNSAVNSARTPVPLRTQIDVDRRTILAKYEELNVTFEVWARKLVLC